MQATVAELARLVDGEVQGNGARVLTSARTLEHAEADHLSFLDSDKYLQKLQQSRAGAVVVPAAFEPDGRTVIRVADPLMAFASLYSVLHDMREPETTGIDARASVDRTAVIGSDASIAAFASIGEGCVIGARCRIGAGAVVGRDCRLGDDVTLHPRAVLYDRTVIGDRVVIHAGAVLGADGFGYRFRGGRHVKVPQLGNVVVGDDVEIGANATIDRGTFESTVVGDGTKIDNLVQIGHNCRIGAHNILVAQVGYGGSCTTGSHVIAAGQAGIADHVTVGAGAIINPQAGVAKEVAPRQRVSSTPAMDWNEHLRLIWATARLPRLLQDIKQIKSRLGISDGT